MIIDCHGHNRTAPREIEGYGQSQIAGLRDPSHVPAKETLNIGDDQIRESVEKAQLRLQRERGTDVTIFSPRAAGMGHHIGDATTSLHWSAEYGRLCHGAPQSVANTRGRGGRTRWRGGAVGGGAL